MSKEIYISSTPHETRLAVVENDDLTEIYYERENEYTLAGSIYNGKVTRVLPGMQSSFVDVGLERDAFLYITDFMEEAGDSADFEAAETRRGPRESREEQGPREVTRSTSEESSGERERLAAPVAEPSNDRGDRDRGRGRGRDRRGNRDNRGGPREDRGNTDDRSGNRERSAEIQAAPPFQAEPGIDLPPAIRSGYIEPGSEATSPELGEGSPGADGSRRWRGRRGRRRGRNSSQRDESQVLQQPAAPPTFDPGAAPTPGRGYQADATDAEDLEEDLDGEYNESFDLHAAAPAPEASLPAEEPQLAEPAPSLRSAEDRPSRDRSDPDSRDRSDREPRDGGDRESRDRNRRDRPGRDRGDRAPRAPRGFAPSRALYGVDSSEAEQPTSDGPAPEPLILPGEVLSKYRKSEDTPAGSTAAATSIPTQIPADYTLQGSWDGGNVLPGETIRPRSNAGEASSPDRFGSDRSSDARGSRDRGGRDRNDRNERQGRNEGRSRDDRFSGRQAGREDRSGRTPSASFAAPSSQAPFRSEASPISPAVPDSEIVKQQRHTEEFSTPNTTATEQHHQPAEYEPEEASASLRFDPTTRSEFRQSAPVEEQEQEQMESSSESVPASENTALFVPSLSAASGPDAPAEHAASTEPSGETRSSYLDAPAQKNSIAHSIAHTITPQPDAPFEPIHTAFREVEAPAAHEFTAIQSTGDMLSDAPAPPPQEVAEPTSPLHHETAVLEAAPEVQPTSPEVHTGHIAEEIFDEEEDFNATTLHASSIEEMDYEEEQTLEGAADLGTMIREMSIDQITRPGDDPDEEDDILEEEDVDDELGAEDSESDLAEDHGFSDNSEIAEPNSFVSGISESDPQTGEHRSTNGSQEAASFSREPDRRSSRRDGGRRGDRDRGRDRGGDRARSTGGSGDRSTSRPGRHSAQSTNLPAITDLLKPGQEVLVQIAKEPIAKKGARITSHIALPGRFLVFMPTVNHTGVSRKIESDTERRRLKEILLSEKGEASGGFIVRTAAANATEEELRSDLRFLLNLWADIKQRSESSKSPALIYHDLNLVERILRDQVTDTFSAIWVDTETEYERVLRFLQRFQPSLIRRVKLYTKETPLFEQFGITEEVNKALRSKVWLKSGGSIVINQTEALVAIDINTGKYVGKTARLEDTIVKTNLDAIPEIIRQIRLRDLGGIIIIDFIDMDERKNRSKVMAALEEELKKDRAPSKVLQFNDFGLVAITRKRVKQSLERTLSTTCNVCQGTGMTKSPVTVCNDIYIEMRKMHKHLDRGDVMLRVHPEVVKQLKAGGTKWLQEMEEMVGKTILVKSDPGLHPEQFDIH